MISAAEHGVVFARPDAGVQYHLTEASAEPLLSISAASAEAPDDHERTDPTPGLGQSPAPETDD